MIKIVAFNYIFIMCCAIFVHRKRFLVQVIESERQIAQIKLSVFVVGRWVCRL